VIGRYEAIRRTTLGRAERRTATASH
jgi:hypothetical protein